MIDLFNYYELIKASYHNFLIKLHLSILEAINKMNEMTDTPFINDGTSMKIVRFNVSIKAHF